MLPTSSFLSLGIENRHPEVGGASGRTGAPPFELIIRMPARHLNRRDRGTSRPSLAKDITNGQCREWPKPGKLGSIAQSSLSMSCRACPEPTTLDPHTGSHNAPPDFHHEVITTHPPDPCAEHPRCVGRRRQRVIRSRASGLSTCDSRSCPHGRARGAPYSPWPKLTTFDTAKFRLPQWAKGCGALPVVSLFGLRGSTIKSDERVNSRNGYRAWEWDTRAAMAVPDRGHSQP